MITPFVAETPIDVRLPLSPTSQTAWPHGHASRDRQGPLAGGKAWTLQECIGATVRNNQELKAAGIEELAKGAAARTYAKRIMPHFTVSSEFGQADTQRWSYSEPLGLQGISGAPLSYGLGISTFGSGRERFTRRHSLEVEWSPNEATYAYLLYRNGVNDRLVSRYDRIRKAQETVGTVEAAYYRLLGMQEALPFAEELVTVRLRTTRKLGELQRRKLITQDRLTEAEEKGVRARLIRFHITSQADQQRSVLAHNMGFSPFLIGEGGLRVAGRLSEPSLDVRSLRSTLREIDASARGNRPEIRRAWTTYMKSINDFKTSILRFCPTLTGHWKYVRDEDKFSYDKEAKDFGVYVKADFLSMWANMEDYQAARLKHLASIKGLSATLSHVSAQVHKAALRFMEAQGQLTYARASQEAADRRLETAHRKKKGGDLEVIAVDEAKALALEKKVDVIQSLAEANAALAELRTALASNYNEPPPVDDNAASLQ